MRLIFFVPSERLVKMRRFELHPLNDKMRVGGKAESKKTKVFLLSNFIFTLSFELLTISAFGFSLFAFYSKKLSALVFLLSA